jgi:hypothetical protein
MCEQKRFGQIRKNRVTVSDPHMNTEADTPSAGNVKLVTGIFTQHDTSFVISCEGHSPTTRMCHYYNPRLRQRFTPYWHSTHHTFSLPHRNPGIPDRHTINLRGRPRPVWHCGFTIVVPRSTHTVWTQRLLPRSEGCTYSIHPLGVPPWGIFSPCSNHRVSTVYIRYHTKH